jgi:hypothetical protein
VITDNSGCADNPQELNVIIDAGKIRIMRRSHYFADGKYDFLDKFIGADAKLFSIWISDFPDRSVDFGPGLYPCRNKRAGIKKISSTFAAHKKTGGRVAAARLRLSRKSALGIHADP